MSTSGPHVDAPIAPHRYGARLAADIERRWQDRWESEGTFHADNPAGELASGAEVPAEKYFLMDMFPYPSGAGLHVGHPLGYIATDVVGRYQRMLGKNVLHALGYDAFGLPAELHAISTGEHPRTNTLANIANMRRQLRRLGLAHDDRRSFATIDPDFVRWTQWIFLQIFDSWYDEEQGRARPIADLVEKLGTDDPEVIDAHRLAYISEAPVNWCPGLGTVLANEEVTAEGRSERGNFPVFQRSLRQWNMRITAYADRLIDDLDALDWPEPVKQMQRHWIGRSHGAEVDFEVPDVENASIRVFTTRPDTLFGATYMVLAPEHELVDAIVTDAWPEGTDGRWTGGAASPTEAVASYRAAAAAKTDVERQENRDKTGVFTGAFAVNPVNGERVPVFVADYVLVGYGTGAIMAVPAHDERDFAFATAFGLPTPRVVAGADGADDDLPFTGAGTAVASANDDVSLDGLGVDEAKARIIAWLESTGRGTGTTTYRLRDWLFSRQRYWGEPFPIVFDEDGHPHAVPDELLPVELPEVPDYSPRTFEPDDADSEPEPPLGRVQDWVNVTLDLGDGPRPYRRETNTMPNWAGSSWYELRYTDPTNPDALCEPENERYWMGSGPRSGVDLYVGGVEHAVLHLLYARFWHKVLFDLGHVSGAEPFHRLVNQGYIQAHAFTDARGTYVPAEQVQETVAEDGTTTYTFEGAPVTREYGKMGKSLKNVVTPDDMYDEFGADTFRVYEMSMGPLDQSRPWETRAVVGSQRFLQRLWRLVVDEDTGETQVVDEPTDDATRRVLHRTIAGVRDDLESLGLNTAIAKLIEYVNHLTKVGARQREAIEPLLLMVAPFAPHLAEELWSRVGHDGSLAHEPFPQPDPDLLVEDTVTCVVQVQGKVRATMQVPASADDAELTERALAEANVQRAIDGREVRKVIVRAPKLVSVVV